MHDDLRIGMQLRDAPCPVHDVLALPVAHGDVGAFAFAGGTEVGRQHVISHLEIGFCDKPGILLCAAITMQDHDPAAAFLVGPEMGGVQEKSVCGF